MGSLMSAPRPLLCNDWCTRFNNSSRVTCFLCVFGAEIIHNEFQMKPVPVQFSTSQYEHSF
jgi:hypothetical protein